jgi:tRNA nucleotidyltransferase (CCA-adding enzyme)
LNQSKKQIDPLDALSSHVAGAVCELARLVQQAGGRALLVGGCVRDAALGLPSKDVDIEVFGLQPEVLERLPRERFRVEAVGKAFGVLMLKGLPIDVSVPRMEHKQGQGHKGFLIESAPDLSFQEAASRRDFRINAMGFDPLTHTLEDPFDGMGDIAQGRLRHVGPAFVEDPLRVLRGMQFAARFGFTVASETVALCRQITPEGLPPERQFEEWAKLILQGQKPSIGLEFLRQSGWLGAYAELAALVGCPQEPCWHPEGDAWTHTCHVMDAFARQRVADDWEDLVVGFACLCHDIGKPVTTLRDAEGVLRSLGHDVAGVPITEAFLGRLSRHKALFEAVLPLVETHMRPAELYKCRASDAAIRRLARKVRIDRLVRVASADMAGRPPLPADFPAAAWLMERAQALALKDAAPKPILKGRHLIALGLRPGKEFGQLLKTAFEAQLDGAFDDEAGAIAYAQEHVPHTKA